jgi:hypothetical protein
LVGWAAHNAVLLRLSPQTLCQLRGIAKKGVGWTDTFQPSLVLSVCGMRRFRFWDGGKIIQRELWLIACFNRMA